MAGSFVRSSAHLASAVALASVLLAAAGCTTGTRLDVGPQKSAPQRSAAFPVDFERYASVGYALDWKAYPTITGSLPIIDLLPASDVIAVLEAGTTVSLLEPLTGSERAASQLTRPLTRFRGLGRKDGRVLAASESELFMLDPQTNTLQARQSFGKIISSPILVWSNLVLAGTPDGELLAHLDAGAAGGGVKLWGFALKGAIEQRPTMVGDAVAAVSQGGDVVFLNPGNGSLRGRSTMFAGSSTTPVSNGSLLFVASLDQSLYGFAPTGGAPVWRVRTSAPLRVQPTAEGDRVWCTIPGKGLSAFDAASGRELWVSKGLEGTVLGTNRGRLVVFTGSEIVLLDAGKGDVLARAAAPGIKMIVPEKFAEGAMFAVSESGVVAKFIPR